LAGHLGFTVEELLDRISAAELAEWRAYWQFEPFGEPWRQTALLAASVRNANGGKGGGRGFSIDDFLPCKTPQSNGKRPGRSIRDSVRRMSSKQLLDTFRLFAVRK
jgi:hypothetical protein